MSKECYNETVKPCGIQIDGTWVTQRGDNFSLVGVIFDTPDGTEWAKEEVRFISRAIDYTESCPSCGEWVGRQTPMLEAVRHRILPCCACSSFVWLIRPDFEDDFVGEHA